MIRQALAILFVFGLLWAALWLVRKKSWSGIRRPKAAGGLIESRGKLALSPRHSVHLIRIGDRYLVLALHPEGVTFLGDEVSASTGERKQGAGK